MVQLIADDTDDLLIRLVEAEVCASVIVDSEPLTRLDRQQRTAEPDSPCSPNLRGEEGLGSHDSDGRARVGDERRELELALSSQQDALVVGVEVAQTGDVSVEARVSGLERVDVAEEGPEHGLLEPQEEDQAVLVEVLLVGEDWNLLQV